MHVPVRRSEDVAVIWIVYVAMSGVPMFVLSRVRAPELVVNCTIPTVLAVQRS